jgi:hypothetical protein
MILLLKLQEQLPEINSTTETWRYTKGVWLFIWQMDKCMPICDERKMAWSHGQGCLCS